MLEALWSVEFQSSFGFGGSGIAVFETGRVFGGDSIMIYTGSYRVSEGSLIVDLNVEKYADVPGMQSVVKMDKFRLKLSGIPAEKRVQLTGYVVEDPNRKITINAVRRADLP